MLRDLANNNADYQSGLRDRYIELHGILALVKKPSTENKYDVYGDLDTENYETNYEYLVPRYQDYYQLLSIFGTNAEQSLPLEVLAKTTSHIPKDSLFDLTVYYPGTFQGNKLTWRVLSSEVKHLETVQARQIMCVPAREREVADVITFQTYYQGSFTPTEIINTGKPLIWYLEGETIAEDNPTYEFEGLNANKTFSVASIDKWRFVTSFKLEGVGLLGRIPEEIGELTSLTSLSLKGNSFSGVLFNSITNLTSLTTLDLSENKLKGEIPTGIASFSNLSVLKLNDNVFSETDLSNFVNALWEKRVGLGSNSCNIDISNNNGLSDVAISQIEGTGDYNGDGLNDNGCLVNY